MEESERDLWQSYRQGDQQAREEIILSHLSLVQVLVRRVSGTATWASREDLMNEGVRGLISAVDRFDPNQGISFKVFAKQYIQHAIFDSVAVPRDLSRHQDEIYRRIRQAELELAKTLQRNPTVEEVAEKTELAVEQIISANDARRVANAAELPNAEDSPASLKLVLKGSRGGFRRLQHLLKSGELSNIDGVGVEGIQWIEVQEVLSRLSEKELLIVTNYYFDDQSAKEIAENLGLEESNVTKIRQRAIAKLRKLLEVEKGGKPHNA